MVKRKEKGQRTDGADGTEGDGYGGWDEGRKRGKMPPKGTTGIQCRVMDIQKHIRGTYGKTKKRHREIQKRDIRKYQKKG